MIDHLGLYPLLAVGEWRVERLRRIRQESIAAFLGSAERAVRLQTIAILLR